MSDAASEASPPPPPGRRDAAPSGEHRFPCDACGADMRFDAEARAMRCDHCGNMELLPPPDPWARAAALREIDIREGLSEDLAGLEPGQVEETQVTRCPNCGARTELDPTVRAAACPFCDTPLVRETVTDRHIKPAAVLPFAWTEPRAKEAMRAWLGSLWFAPNGLTKYARAGRPMSGVYVPYWTFDARSDTAYVGQRGDNYTVRVPRADGKGSTTQVRVRWRRASGRVRLSFDDVLVPAAASLPREMVEGLEPWDLRELEPYRPAMVAGFGAESYTVGLREGLAAGKARMERVIAGAVRRDIGGDHQRIHDMRTRLSDVTFKHVLLPIWIAAYRYNGQSYRFVVNARTGKVQGERPYSAIKIALAVIAALIALAVGALLYGGAQGGFRLGDAAHAPITAAVDAGGGGPSDASPPPAPRASLGAPVSPASSTSSGATLAPAWGGGVVGPPFLPAAATFPAPGAASAPEPALVSAPADGRAA